MSENDDPLLADFGISSIMTSSSTTNSTTGIKGSARWMAFELLSPRLEETEESGKHTKKTDVWAYGMVVYVRFIYRFGINLADVFIFFLTLGATNWPCSVFSPQERSAGVCRDRGRPATNETDGAQ